MRRFVARLLRRLADRIAPEQEIRVHLTGTNPWLQPDPQLIDWLKERP